MARLPRLPGSPAQPFAVRFNMLAVSVFPAINYVSLALVVVMWARALPHLKPAGHLWFKLWLGIQGGVHAATLVWTKLHPASHARWQALPALVFRLYGLGFGAAYEMCRDMLSLLPAPAQGGALAAAKHASLLVTFSHSLSMVIWSAAPLRLGWAALTQAAVVLHALAYSNPMLCPVPALTGGHAAELTHQAFRALDLASFSMAAPLTLAAEVAAAAGGGDGGALPAEAECRALMGFLQLAAGLVAPLALQAWLEAQLWRQHQQQRRAAGLRPEPGGWHGRAYAFLIDLAEGLDPLSAAMAAWILGGILFDVAVAASGAPLPEMTTPV